MGQPGSPPQLCLLVLGGPGDRNFTPSQGRQPECNQGLGHACKGVQFIVTLSGDGDPKYPPHRDGKPRGRSASLLTWAVMQAWGLGTGTPLCQSMVSLPPVC